MEKSRDAAAGGRERAGEYKQGDNGGEGSRQRGNVEEDGDHRIIRRPSKNPTRDHHKRHLEKLMENPDRPVSIPEPAKDRKPQEPPEFVRFYMGSSAGAGSEVFHVYRHLRRRENDRQDYIASKASEEQLEEEFQQTRATHRAQDEARRANKREKRLKRKQRQKLAKKMAKVTETGRADPEEDSSSSEHEQDSEQDSEEQHFTIVGK